jgi:hypothetical protein
MTALPKWKCHKVVEAAKITGVTFPPDGAALHLVGADPEHVTGEWLRRNIPAGRMWIELVGGYFVRYDTGYTSWSPAEAFEKGYTRVEDAGESNLVRYAEEELRRTGLGDPDADYGGAVAAAVLELVRVFAAHRHSGGSAMLTLEVFGRVARFKPLSPLTSDPAEWMDVSEYSGRPQWQSKRCPSVFSDDGGKTWHDLDAAAATEGR